MADYEITGPADCCCGDTPDPLACCSMCPAGRSRRMEFTIEGVTNAICPDCDTVNRSYSLLVNGDGAACAWVSSVTGFCDDDILVQIDHGPTVGGDWTLRFFLGGGTTFGYYVPDETGFDCVSGGTFTLSMSDPECADCVGFCTGMPATITVVGAGGSGGMCPCCYGPDFVYPANLTLTVTGSGRLAGSYNLEFQCAGCFNPGEVAYTTITSWDDPDACDDVIYPPYGKEVTNYPLTGGGWVSWSLTCQWITGSHYWGLSMFYESFRFLQCASHPNEIGVEALQTDCKPMAIDFGTADWEGVTYTMTVSE